MTRFIPKQFAENSTTSVVFGSHQDQGGKVGDGTISSDPATLQGGAAWPLGWKAATDNFFQIPRGEEMEGLERVLSAAIIQQFKDGLTFWQSEMPVTQYQTIVQYQTGSDLPKLYVNITGTSTSTPPDSDTTNWKEMSLGGNTPFFFGQSMYSENAPYNASWLASNGQYNASTLYPDFWTQLTGVELNTSLSVGDTIEIGGKTYVKRGLPVVLSTGTYTDYDFVINQNDQTFRLPLLNGEEDLPSDRYTDLTLGTSGSPFTAPANGKLCLVKAASTAGQYIAIVKGSYRAGDTAGVNGETLTVEIDMSKGETATVIYSVSGSTVLYRFVYSKGNGSLYYYVGDTVQDASLINAGAVLGQLSNKADIDASNFNADGKSLLSGLGMPSNRYIDLTLGASGSTYTAPANGWFAGWTSTGAGNGYVVFRIGELGKGYANEVAGLQGYQLPLLLPIKKGTNMIVQYNILSLVMFRFYYAEGAN